MPLQMFQTISHFIRQALLPVEEAGRGLLWIGLAWCLVSCTGNKVYDHYEQTPTTGWEKNDTLAFGVPPIAADGLYAIDLGLRTTGLYPFMSITLVVEHDIIPTQTTTTSADSLDIPVSPTLIRNSRAVPHILNCSLVDERGNTKGQGINYYQHDFHLADLTLHAGDSLRLLIRHDMKREILPGISDVGIRIHRH